MAKSGRRAPQARTPANSMDTDSEQGRSNAGFELVFGEFGACGETGHRRGCFDRDD